MIQRDYAELESRLASTEERLSSISAARDSERRTHELAVTELRRQIAEDAERLNVKMREKEEEMTNERREWLSVRRETEEEKKRLRDNLETSARHTESLQQRLNEADEELKDLRAQIKSVRDLFIYRYQDQLRELQNIPSLLTVRRSATPARRARRRRCVWPTRRSAPRRRRIVRCSKSDERLSTWQPSSKPQKPSCMVQTDDMFCFYFYFYFF